jgi:hypothetical protein
MLPDTQGQKRSCSIFTLRRLVQWHQALLQFMHAVIYLLAYLIGVGQQPGLQLLYFPYDLPSASLILG